MLPIYLKNNNEGLVFDEFVDELAEICSQHHMEGRASAFAFIIYDETTPQITKVLHDDDYWNALNVISGKYLTIFSLLESPLKEKLKSRQNTYRTTMRYSMFNSHTDENLDISYKEIINKFFNGIEFATPSLLFFQVKGNNINDYFTLTIKADNIEESFIEIKKVIEECVYAIKDISAENLKNYDEIFSMLKVRVTQHKNWIVISKFLPKITILDILSIFK